MTPAQYQKAKERLGLSHERLAALLGITRRTSQRYAHGHMEVPLALGVLLRLVSTGKVPIEEVRP